MATHGWLVEGVWWLNMGGWLRDSGGAYGCLVEGVWW